MFNHLHQDRSFPITSGLDAGSRTMINLTQSGGSSIIPGRSSELDITPPSMEDEEFHSNSDDDSRIGISSGISPGEDKKKYPEYCRTIKIKGRKFEVLYRRISVVVFFISGKKDNFGIIGLFESTPPLCSPR